MKNSGQALIMILVISVVIGLGITAGLSRVHGPLVLQNGLAIRANLWALKKTLLNNIDCTQTVSGITASTSCRTNPVGNQGIAITLKDSSGAALAPGGVLGRFDLQANCWESVAGGVGTGNYYVAVRARVKDEAGNVMIDPMSTSGTPVALDFNANINKLFQEADGLCAAALGSVSAPPPSSAPFITVTAPLYRGTTVPTQPQTTDGCSSNGRPNGTGDCFLGTVIGHNFTLPVIDGNTYNDFRTEQCDLGCGGGRDRAIYGFRWLGTAMCPTGYKALSGGANCRTLGGYSHMQNGIMISTHPLADGSGWRTSCCGGNRSSIAAGGAHPTETTWVTCVKENGPS